MSLLSAILLLALTRAEIIERMKAPVVNQADGLIQVVADCPEDMRREYQSPIARFAAETVKMLYQGLSIKPQRHTAAPIVIYVGDIRTNVNEVVVKAAKREVGNHAGEMVTRIYLKSPGYADLGKFKLEVIKAFARSVQGEEIDDREAIRRYRKADPQFRVMDARRQVERWLTGATVAETNAPTQWQADDEGIRLTRRVIEPGFASRRDVLIFASRLYLYPFYYDQPFVGNNFALSFREALKLTKVDPRIRLAAYFRASDVAVLGGGRGDTLNAAAKGYCDFLLELASGEKGEEELSNMLEAADAKLNVAFEEARKREEGIRQ